MQLSIEKVYEK